MSEINDGDDVRLVCRRILIDFGRTPVSPWLDHVTTLSDLHVIQDALLSRETSEKRRVCRSPESMSPSSSLKRQRHQDEEQESAREEGKCVQMEDIDDVTDDTDDDPVEQCG